MQATQITLAKRPTGRVEADVFSSRIIDLGEPEDGQMLVENLFMSVDPYMRGRMNDVKSYMPPWQIGNPCEAGIVGRVLKSNGGRFKEGDVIGGLGLWASHMITDGEGFQQVPTNLGIPLSHFIGVLGMPGMTAWVGLKGVAELKDGETVFVSAASGAVGQVVGQIAKNKGCRIIGSAGGTEKCAYLTDELGFNAAIDYKAGGNLPAKVAEAAPGGIDVVFENVGGPMFEAVIANLNTHARIALCGYISAYNVPIEQMPAGPRNLALLIARKARMQGFIVMDYPDLCMEWMQTGGQWLAEGKLKYRESVTEGLENAPKAFMDMMDGKNFGKQIVKIAD